MSFPARDAEVVPGLDEVGRSRVTQESTPRTPERTFPGLAVNNGHEPVDTGRESVGTGPSPFGRR